MDGELVCLTGTEWVVLDYLWEAPPQTTTQLAHTLAGREGWVKSTTTVVLKRMTEKGLFTCRQGERVKWYTPAMERRTTTVSGIYSFLRRICRESVSMLINAAAELERLSREEIDAFYDILKGLEEKEHGWVDSDAVPADHDCAGRAGPALGADGPAAAVRPVAAGAPAPSGVGHGVPDRIERAKLCAPVPDGYGASPAVPVRRESLRPRGGAHARPAGGGDGIPALRPGGRAGLRARRGSGLEGHSDRGVAGRRGGADRRPVGVQPALLSAPAADAADPSHSGGGRTGLRGSRAAPPLPVRLPAARGLSDPGGGRQTGAAGPRPAS